MILLTAIYMTITFLIELNPFSEKCVIAVIEWHSFITSIFSHFLFVLRKANIYTAGWSMNIARKVQFKGDV